MSTDGGYSVNDVYGQEFPDKVPAQPGPAFAISQTEIDGLLRFAKGKDSPVMPSRLKRRTVFELDSYVISEGEPGAVCITHPTMSETVQLNADHTPDLIEALKVLHAEHVARGDS